MSIKAIDVVMITSIMMTAMMSIITFILIQIHWISSNIYPGTRSCNYSVPIDYAVNPRCVSFCCIPLQTVIAFGDDLQSTKRVNRRRLSSDSVRYVEMAVVNDPAMMEEYDGDEDLLILKAIESIATVQAFYLQTDWGSNVGTVQVVLSQIGFVYNFSTFSVDGLVQPVCFPIFCLRTNGQYLLFPIFSRICRVKMEGVHRISIKVRIRDRIAKWNMSRI